MQCKCNDNTAQEAIEHATAVDVTEQIAGRWNILTSNAKCNNTNLERYDSILETYLLCTWQRASSCYNTRTARINNANEAESLRRSGDTLPVGCVLFLRVLFAANPWVREVLGLLAHVLPLGAVGGHQM